MLKKIKKQMLVFGLTGLMGAGSLFSGLAAQNVYAEETADVNVTDTASEYSSVPDVSPGEVPVGTDAEGESSPAEEPQEQQEVKEIKTEDTADKTRETEVKTTGGVGAAKETGNTHAAEAIGAVKNGWVKVKGGYKYYKNGKAYTGWHKMGKAEGEKKTHWSYFGKNGIVYTGWKKMGKAEGEKTAHWCYFGSNGWMRTGWVQFGKGTSNPDGGVKKHWSYFGNNGWMRTGWVQFGKGTSEPDGNVAKHWSYFGNNGWMRTGWVQFGKGTSEPDGNVAKHWSFFGDNGWMRTGLQNMGKGTSNPDGNTAKHQSYFGNNGWLRVNQNVTVNGKRYKADKNGWLKEVYIKLKSGIQQLRNMTYGEYKARFGRTMKYSYLSVVWNDTNPDPLPGLNVTVSFRGTYKNEQYLLPDDSKVMAVYGKIGDLFDGIEGTLSYDKLINLMTVPGGESAYGKRGYSRGMASYHPSIVFDGNGNGKASDRITFYTYVDADRADNVNKNTVVTLSTVDTEMGF